MARAVEALSRVVDVDALQRGGEAVGISFAPDFAVGDDVDAGFLLRPDREHRGVVLRLREQRLRDPPQLLGAQPRRKALAELVAVDQPVGLRVAADQGGGKEQLFVFSHRQILEKSFAGGPGRYGHYAEYSSRRSPAGSISCARENAHTKIGRAH